MVYASLKKIKAVLDRIFRPLMKLLHNLGVKPVHLTLLSLPSGTFGVLFLFKNPLVAFPLVLAYLAFDIMDGMLARHTDNTTEFGHLLDYNVDKLIASMFLVSLLLNTEIRLLPAFGLLAIGLITLEELGFKFRRFK
ncbi:MAG TPA: CDP-alcohol phosphatidyltransferase family protein [Candidatus Altiarchaeales archaeon]|nr:CDP-alcohol phosphatidyltransferase family protein [Candidatus Altiarchaeales archaeon]